MKVEYKILNEKNKKASTFIVTVAYLIFQNRKKHKLRNYFNFQAFLSKFSCNSEANASKFRENAEEMFPWYYVCP